ncbi:MAG: hypothetical protein QG625_1837, partial [Cyanobacteriota bacterium erpe_2018_sw_39hr_WHONDRS-SW48-000098_B_bin.30]|nr:hypothetical protein [Cyanobacteriota bacterium erpe_2018_sw_39hr_WHONDRS-SW48-000098_B_bin.30]
GQSFVYQPFVVSGFDDVGFGGFAACQYQYVVFGKSTGFGVAESVYHVEYIATGVFDWFDIAVVIARYANQYSPFVSDVEGLWFDWFGRLDCFGSACLGLRF